MRNIISTTVLSPIAKIPQPVCEITRTLVDKGHIQRCYPVSYVCAKISLNYVWRIVSMSYPDPVSNHISSISVITHDYRTFPGIKIKLAYFIPSITTNPLIYLNRCTYKSMVYRIRRIRSILVRAGPPGEYLVGSSLRKGEDPTKLTPLTGGTINIILFIVSCSRLGLYPVPNRLTRRRP